MTDIKEGVFYTYVFTFVLFCCLSFINTETALGQTFSISGYIENGSSGERLISATVIDVNTDNGTTTNDFGYFNLNLEEDSVVLVLSYLGFKDKFIKFYHNKDTVVSIGLESTIDLKKVEISANKSENIQESTEMSTIEIPITQIKNIPMLFGEADVLKTVQLLPGVQSGGEGQSGFYVRGGSADQNLMLLDGTPVYNASHMFGLFSVFNPDAIKDVKLVKGGFPARYGSRLSSILDIRMKEGNMKEYDGSASIGSIAIKGTIEGPIVKDKMSFIVSGRRTYIDILTRPLFGLANDIDIIPGYFFYDLNTKMNYKVSDRDRLFLSAYFGRDIFSTRNKKNSDFVGKEFESKLGWGNVTTSLRWNHIFNPALFSNAHLTYSKFTFFTANDSKGEGYSYSIQYNSYIEDWSARYEFDYTPHPNHYIRFGGQGIYHDFNPGEFYFNIEESNNVSDTTFEQSQKYAFEHNIYAEDDWKVNSWLKVNLGFHFSGFVVDNQYYTSPQVRLSSRILLTKKNSLKFSFSQMQQYINLLTNDGLSLPTDLWLPSTERIVPQSSWQVAAGYSHNLWDNYQLEIETYYKNMKNGTSYKEGSTFFSFENWENRITQGIGRSYGVEFLIQKKIGDFTGWIAYTLSKSERRFDDLNYGEWFPFKYDRRHDLSVVATYRKSERFNVSTTFVYSTGNAVTVPFSESYKFNENGSGHLSISDDVLEKNNYRYPSYIRLDIGFNFIKEKKYGTRTWSVGAYNLLARANPFFLYIGSKYDPNTSTRQNTLYQSSLFPLLPYINYTYEF